MSCGGSPANTRLFRLRRGRSRLGRYTDDTQMTLALAKSLVARGKCDPKDAATQYALHYEPFGSRGYSRRTGQVRLSHRGACAPAWQQGILWQLPGPKQALQSMLHVRNPPQILKQLVGGQHHAASFLAHFPEGSWGNGGAMRIAPVGIAYRWAQQAALQHRKRGGPDA
jgi:ADP-ribosylglycohydrolase